MIAFFELFAQPEIWLSLLTLTVMEIVLGIDNIIFISILVGRLPEDQREKARRIGLSLALILRLLLLSLIAYLAQLTDPLFSVGEFAFSGRDLILIGGGGFLIAKSTKEIHDKVEGDAEAEMKKRRMPSFWSVITQVIMLDIVFSLDSVITAIGLVDELVIMIVAVIIAMGVMLAFARSVSEFIERHPTMKMLALSFLLMIGLLLLVEGFQVHVPKGYVYFAMAFSVFVEFLNLRARKKRDKTAAQH